MVASTMVLASVLTSAIAASNTELSTDKDRLSYAFGAQTGIAFKERNMDIDPKIFYKALTDAYNEKKLQMTNEEMKVAVMDFTKKQMEQRQADQKVLADKNKKAGDEFLAKNKNASGVKTLPSGLQYKILTKGKGVVASNTDSVTVDYEGTLLDGTVFDSSYKRGEPATFPVNGVIKGWTEALTMMPEGSKWRLFIPSDLAYGENGTMSGSIPPNATLIFDVDLKKVKPSAKSAAS